MEIEVAGHLDESEAIERLRRCFALYLNYPFGWRDRVLRRTSFPTKFSTYICAARPILVHAPPDSTISGLADAGNGYAHAWLSRDPRDGARRLRDLWTSSVAPERLAESAEGVRRQYFSPEQNRPAMRLILRSLCASARAELH